MIRLDAALRERLRANLEKFERRAQQGSGLVPAAVAATLLHDDEDRAAFVLTRRAAGLRAHGGQFALPGGRCDPGESAAETALRELREEVGLVAGPEDVLGLLDDFVTRSGYVITPVVVWVEDAKPLAPNPAEVAEAYRIPLDVLEEPQVPHIWSIPESDRPVLSVPIAGLERSVHAPTAAFIYQLREVALHGRATRVAHYEQPVFAWS